MEDCCGGDKRDDKHEERRDSHVEKGDEMHGGDKDKGREANDLLKNAVNPQNNAQNRPKKKTLVLITAVAGAVFIVALIVFLLFINVSSKNAAGVNSLLQNTPIHGPSDINFNSLAQTVYPYGGFILPVVWGDSIKILLESGALNKTALVAAIESSNQTLTPYETAIMNGTFDGYIYVNHSDSSFLLYALWSLGVNNNNSIIDKGPLMQLGDPDNYASTGGYLPLGELRLGALSIINLTPLQESEAINISEATFRPCCNNPAAFPDCNHGAAELALIEMMTSQGYNQSTTFKVLRNFLSEYYPQNMFDEAVVFASQGVNFSSVSANTTVSYSLFSATGAQNVGAYIQKYGLLQSSSTSSGGGSCSA